MAIFTGLILRTIRAILSPEQGLFTIYLLDDPTLLTDAWSILRWWIESSRSISLMSDSLRRDVVDGGERWSVEGMVEADSVSTNIPRRWKKNNISLFHWEMAELNNYLET